MLIAILSLLVAAPAGAKIVLQPGVADGMTLQPRAEVELRGVCNPFSPISVTCSWNKSTFAGKGDEQGDWRIVIETPEQAGGPYILFFSEMVGGDKAEVRDVRVAGTPGPARKQDNSLRLPAILGDDMVMQRESQANVWGWAAPGRKVTVTSSWDGKRYEATAGKNGEWLVKVATPAAGGPYELTVSAEKTIELQNILIGDVWVCAGQSNMEMPVIGFWSQSVDGAADAILASAGETKVRFATVERQTAMEPCKDCHTQWRVPSMKTTPSVSAIAYFFAREVAARTGIPQGVVCASWGSARMEAFMTPAAIERAGVSLQADVRKEMIQSYPTYLYNGMIAPIIRFTAKGFLWDQGAANRFEWKQFARLTQSMVAQWREDWGDEKMPFYNIQMSPSAFGKPDNLEMALTMEAQLEAVRITPHAYIVPASDICDEQPHQPQKEIVGRRTALIALVKTYGMPSELPVDPPMLDSVSYQGKKAVVWFKNVWYGLLPAREPLLGFELAGEDRQFYPATAKVVRGVPAVEVTSDKVANPVAVRYAFRNMVRTNLTNTTGLPAYPFRTDQWE